MANYKFQTPDERLRGVNYLRQREEQRSFQLDQRLDAELKVEKERGADLDITEQLRVETQRRDELDERFREVEQRQQPPAFPSRTPIGEPTFTPTPTPRSRVEQILESGRSPLAVMAEKDIARQRERGANIGGFLRTLETIDKPRQFVKREVIEPVVPEFDLGPIPTETIAAPFQEVMTGVARLGGVQEEQIPDVAETLGEIRITSELVEEAASWARKLPGPQGASWGKS